MNTTIATRVVPLVALLGLTAEGARAGDEFPPFSSVSEGYEKVVSTTDGSSLYTLYKREKDAQLLAELPASFESQKIFIHNVVSGGNPLAGVGLIMSGERYLYWKRIDKKLALMEPELMMRATGSPEDKQSSAQLFTDRVMLSVPIVTMGPGGGPVIDLDALMVQRSSSFFGPMTRGADASLARLKEAKAFPHNLEIAFEVPLAQGTPAAPMFGLDLAPSSAGRMTELHYSILLVPQDPTYEPRAADPRIGFFTTAYNDLSKTTGGPETWVRYITRWKLEKADPSLRLSPPKEPLVWYIEHTTPIKYRRHIRDGLLAWNRAFEKIGIVDAIEVRQQDSRTGAYMDVDPEDMRYAFVRWNNNQAAFAIGPSRVNPETGQIFDADVTINAGIVATFANGFRDLMPALSIEGFTPETMAWLDEHPSWDPRVRLAAPAERERLIAERAARRAAGEPAVYPAGRAAGIGSQMVDSLRAAGVTVEDDAVHCLAGAYAALGTGMMRLVSAASGADETEDTLDGLPEEYVGQLLHWLTLHEVGHCLGLRHNFMASTVYGLDAINAETWPEDRATGGSVMEYVPPNINEGLGEKQGQWLIHQPGPYDDWVVEYGYGFADDLGAVLDKSSQPELVFGDNADQVGPDPRVRTYDFGADPIRFCESRMELIRGLRSKIVGELVEDGQRWGEARRAYTTLLGQHVTALSIVANWIGGSYVHKDRKGQPNGRVPIEPVPVGMQRRALDFVIANSFQASAFGLDRDLLNHLMVDRWGDLGDIDTWDSDPAFPVHDMVQGIQSVALTMTLNPTTLRRVHDNEYRIPEGEDALTVAEVLSKLVSASFDELSSPPTRDRDARHPAISSFRRNLQSELVGRLIDLSLDDDPDGTARTIGALARAALKEVHGGIETYREEAAGKLDPYTSSHLADLSERVEQALAARFVRER